MQSAAQLEQDAKAQGLTVRGLFQPQPDPVLPENTVSLALLGPDEPGFWPRFSAAPEAHDALPDPLDRWSKRVIGDLAVQWNGTPVFPSDGPPFPPFLSWALASGKAWVAPVGLLVHSDAGLWLSFRGAVALPYSVTDTTPRSPSPCLTCTDRPCLSACPVGAMGPDKEYDVPACKNHVGSQAGQTCKTGGCLVRRVCPVSKSLGRQDAQAGFHMRAFMGE